MDLIVCGDAFWITCGTWIAIWNGAIGAFVAAVLGAFVALGVVVMSNRHQSHLSDLARNDAKSEAEKAREIIAIADLISLTARMGWSDTIESFDAGEAYQKLEAARVRLQMASPSSAPLAKAMQGWASLLTSLAMAEAKAKKLEHHLQSDIHATLARSTSVITACLPDWPHDDEFSRQASLIMLGTAKAQMTSTQAAAIKSGMLLVQTTEGNPDSVIAS